MGLPRTRKGILIAGTVVVLVVGAGLFAAYHIALVRLHDRIVAVLGDGSEVGQVEVGLTAVELENIELPAPSGFPAHDQLRLSHVRIEPELSSLWHPRDVVMGQVTVEHAYIAAWREHSGRLSVIPTVLGPAVPANAPRARGAARATPARFVEAQPAASGAPSEAAPGSAFTIRELSIHDLEIEYIDSAIATPPHRIELDHLEINVEPLHYPVTEGRVELRLKGQVRGATPHAAAGSIEVSGWIAPAIGESDLQTRLAGVDLVDFQPYLRRATSSGVRQGIVGLQVHSTIRGGRVKAPGSVSLEHLELESGGGDALSTLLGIPRAVLIDGIANQSGPMTVHFEVAGSVDDPTFALEEGVPVQIGAALASVLGLSVTDVAKGVGTVGAVGVDTGERVLKGLGNAVGRLGQH